MLEFFTAQVNNDHTRKAYLGIRELAAVEPFHVAAFVKQLQEEFSVYSCCPLSGFRSCGLRASQRRMEFALAIRSIY